MLDFANSTVGCKYLCYFISIKFDVEKSGWLQKFIACVTKFLCVYWYFQFLSKSGIHYLWQGEISIWKVLVLSKVILGNNDYLICAVLTEKTLTHILITRSLANTNLNLIRSTYSKLLLAIESLVFLLHLIYDYVIV